HPPPAES
ncbi:hypothetical protein CFOL_v3_34949, partial [Cephalotus follicularis]